MINMYNFDLLNEEEIVKIFDELLIKQGDRQKMISAVLTNKRLLFFEFVNDDYIETLRTARGMSFIRNKDVSYIIDLKNIESIVEEEYYVINLKDNISFEFDDKELFELLSK